MMPDHTDELTAMAQGDGMYDVDETTPFRCYPDAEPEIKPRVDEYGVGWCSRNCQHAGAVGYGDYVSCDVAEEKGCKLVQPWTEVCPVATRRMARELAEANGQTDLYKERIQQLYASHARKDVELARLRVEVRAWRCGLLEYDEDPYMDEVLWCAYLSGGWVKFHTIDAAIDALMAEDARNQTETQDNGEQEQGRR